jgi:hypothetical protein
MEHCEVSGEVLIFFVKNKSNQEKLVINRAYQSGDESRDGVLPKESDESFNIGICVKEDI